MTVILLHYAIAGFLLFNDIGRVAVDHIHVKSIDSLIDKTNGCQYMYLLTTRLDRNQGFYESNNEYWVVVSTDKPLSIFSKRFINLNQLTDLTEYFWKAQLLWINHGIRSNNQLVKQSGLLKKTNYWMLVFDKRTYKNLMIANVGMEFLIGFDHDLPIEMDNNLSEKHLYSLHCRTGKITYLTNPNYLLRTFSRY